MGFGTLASGAFGLAETIGFSVDDIFGGNDCTDSKKALADQLQEEIQQYLTVEDRQNLVAGTESNVSPTPGAMATFFIGGRDCKHKNVSSGDQQFLNRLRPLIRQRKSEYQQQAAVAGAGVGDGAGATTTGFQFPQWAFFGLVALVLGYLVTQ